MGESFRIGTVFGIRVGANWSVLVVLGLVAYSLAAGILPSQAPGEPASVYWGAGLVSAVLFLASLVAHELAHALVAIRRGIRVGGITLWIFGGVARLTDEMPSPRSEALVAAAGPAMSLGLGVLLYGLGLGLRPSAPLWLAVAVLWLGTMNLILGIFNLIPAFPLDGGRLLRALLWSRSGDLATATRRAAGAGQAFGYLMVVGGVVETLFSSVISGLWTVMIGWFLLAASNAERAQVSERAALAGLRVADIMTPDPVVGPDWVTVGSFIDDYALTHRFTTFPVRSFDGALSGLVTFAALKQVPPEARGRVRVSEVMVPVTQVTVASPEEPVWDVVRRMNPLGRVLVIADGKLVGILSSSDVAFALRRAALAAHPPRWVATRERASG